MLNCEGPMNLEGHWKFVAFNRPRVCHGTGTDSEYSPSIITIALDAVGSGSMASQDTASLVKRLAGPSAGKAGLSTDQREINRIIAQVSKGSKFYEASTNNSLAHSSTCLSLSPHTERKAEG